MIDAKKFVVAFLILAALGSSSALILSRSGGNEAGISVASDASGTLAAAVAVYTNAFVSSSPGTMAVENAAGIVMAPASSSDNITSQLVGAYVDNINIAPSDASQGNSTDSLIVDAPTAQALLSAMTSSSILAKVKIPDWNREAAMQPMTVSTDTSPAAVAAYASALENIFNEYVVKEGLWGIIDDPNAATPGNFSLAAAILNKAMDNLTAERVPSNFVDFQKSLVTVATYDKNTIALTQAAPADPVKAMIIAQAERKGMNDAIQNLQTQWQKALANGTFAAAILRQPGARPNAAVAFIDGLIGTRVAHAQYSDIIAYAERIGLYLLRFAADVALQLLKDGIVQQLMGRALSLIRNSGNPLFIRAFGSFLSGAFNVAAGAALGQIFPTLCGNFSTDVGSWLKNSFRSANITAGGISLNGSPGTNCTLQNAIPNVPGYYQNFNTAGFSGFATLLQPNNNPYGAFMEAFDSVANVAFANQQAQQAKAVASQGYIPQQTCANGAATTNSTCANGTEPTTHTPGATLSKFLSDRLGADTHLTVNATAIVGVLTTVAANAIMSALNSSGIL